MCWRISYRIEMICKSLGINYHSPHLSKINFHADALRLNDLYYQLKQTVAKMVEIADKHGAEDLANILWNNIQLLEQVDHDLIKIAKIMNERGKKIDEN